MAEEISDTYLQEVIKRGDEGSELLASVCASTLKANEFVRIIGPDKRIALQVPEVNIVVHSATARHYSNRADTACSLVDNLCRAAKEIGATPIAMTNIIDSRTGDKQMLREIAEPMAEECTKRKVVAITGENAILGNVVNGDFNLSGTIISLLPPDITLKDGTFEQDGIKYSTFRPDNRYVVANSDGIGTKTRFYQRRGLWWPSVNDFLAMVLDDQAKIRGAQVKVVSGVIETPLGLGDTFDCQEYMQNRCKEMGILGALQPATGKLNAYKEKVIAYNIGGTAVGLVSEKDLENPLVPSSGDAVIAIRGMPNPRSNGITDKRTKMIQLFGENWHETKIGKIFLEYLAEPSTVLYPVFSELINRDLASGIFHMSGGAYNGKFARPLAKVNRFAEIAGLFAPDWRELTLIGAGLMPAQVAYSKYPMGNEGFVTSSKPEEAIERIERHRLEAKVVGVVKDATEVGRTGLELHAYNGEKVYFSGK